MPELVLMLAGLMRTGEIDSDPVDPADVLVDLNSAVVDQFPEL